MNINRTTVNSWARTFLALFSALSFLFVTVAAGHGVVNIIIAVIFFFTPLVILAAYGLYGAWLKFRAAFAMDKDLYFKRVVIALLYCLPWPLLAWWRSDESAKDVALWSSLPFAALSLIELLYATIWKYKK